MVLVFERTTIYLSNRGLLIPISLLGMLKHKLFLTGFIFCVFMLFSKPRPSKYEFFWAIRHPFSALKVKRVYKKASLIYVLQKQKQQPDSFSVNGKLDAFRHVFFMAAFSQKIKSNKLVKLGEAHEKANYKQFECDPKREKVQQDSLSTVMDLNNNRIGIKLGKDCDGCPLEELRDKVLFLIESKRVYFIRRNKEGNYITNTNEIIQISDFNGKWFIPFDLVMPEPH